MSKCLVIVDFQSCYEPPYELTNPILERVNEFKAACDPIIVLEFLGMCGLARNDTFPEIVEAVRDYTFGRFLYKDHKDGSNEVLKLLRKECWPIEEFFVCGGFRCDCVYHTAKGLGGIILQDLCFCHHGDLDVCLRNRSFKWDSQDCNNIQHLAHQGAIL